MDELFQSAKMTEFFPCFIGNWRAVHKCSENLEPHSISVNCDYCNVQLRILASHFHASEYVNDGRTLPVII